MSKWDELTMAEKAEMMKVAVRNGITSLSDIRDRYNEYAEGGNLFGGGGNTVVTDDLVDWTIKEEGFNRQPKDIGDGKITLGSGLTAKRWHDLYKKKGNKWSDADNRMAVRQELSEREAWAKNNVPNWKSLPDSSKEALLLYKYNYDFNQANSPKLFAALAAGNLQEAARQMDATSKDPKFRKGLMDRRKREQEHFLLGVNPTPSLPVQAPRRDITVEYPVSTSVYNPFATQANNTQVMSMMVPDEGSYVTTHEVSPSEQRAESIKNRFDAINRFNVLMDLINPQNNPVPEFMPTTGNSFLDALGLFANSNAKGGKIHIKPENRGKFTALKKRTGHSATWFREHGTPAQKKMAVFALNARKWKHGDGGNLFSGEGNHSQQIITTGGAGYVPPAIDVSKTKQSINKRLYKTISPLEANYSLLPALQSFLSNKECDDTRDGINEEYPVGTVDAIWAKYLQVPEKDRRYSDRLERSSYRPSKGSNSDDYYKLPLQDYEKESLVNTTRELPLYNNKVSKLLNNYALGEHAVGRGYDNRGEYASYFDVFDINPFNGKYGGINIPIVNKLEDIGIGKPVRIYDRIYLDDYYGVKEPTHATYLPEVIVTGKKKKAFGGKR